MGKIFLDTDILIDFLRGIDKAVKTINSFINKSEELCTTSINAFELYWGSYKLGGEEKVRSVEKLLTNLHVINFTEREAKACGEETTYLESIGLSIDLRDLLIGVTTRENNGKIVTGNAKHFKRIRGLKIIEYR